jgi:predicted HTH transcriptional regulator
VKPVEDWDENDLELVVQDKQKENVSIDYKASQALNFDDKKPLPKSNRTLGQKHREEMIRDVAAMANAAGGIIIYGIAEEDGGYPDHVDDGYDATKTNADRVEQILITNIHPRLEGLSIKPIELKSKVGRFAFVLSIPQASLHAPHQADDKLYYKRHEATRMVMDDYEIRDMMRRSIEFGKKFGVARDLLMEVRRLIAAANERSKMPDGLVPKASLIIAVLNDLRASGVAVMSLRRVLRDRTVELVGAVDRYNSTIEQLSRVTENRL